MDALETLLRPVVSILNKNIAEITRARDLCQQLNGTTVAIRVKDTALAGYFTVNEDSISLSQDADGEPDVCISGSLITLARMAGSGGDDAIRDGSLELTGDAETAEAFQNLLMAAKPDLEEGVASIVGDAAAHSLGELGRGIGRWARDARSTMGDNIREYLQEESRDLPSRYEVERFTTAVGTLRDDVDRLVARVTRLQDHSD
jgi:ubiquinone biosynthesis accessory factor UbiJ